MMDILKLVEEKGIVPIVLPTFSVDQTIQACEAAKEAGMPVVEILQRNENSEKILMEAIKKCPEVAVGAGSIMNAEQAKKVINLGAKFIISAGLDEELVKYCLENNVPVIPGTATPTEMQKALNLGLTILKFFPAIQMGGVEFINTVGGPYPSAQFVVTGGLGFNHINEYAKCKKVVACGGVWMFCEEYDPTPKPYNDMVKILKESITVFKNAR